MEWLKGFVKHDGVYVDGVDYGLKNGRVLYRRAIPDTTGRSSDGSLHYISEEYDTDEHAICLFNNYVFFCVPSDIELDGGPVILETSPFEYEELNGTGITTFIMKDTDCDHLSVILDIDGEYAYVEGDGISSSWNPQGKCLRFGNYVVIQLSDSRCLVITLRNGSVDKAVDVDIEDFVATGDGVVLVESDYEAIVIGKYINGYTMFNAFEIKSHVYDEYSDITEEHGDCLTFFEDGDHRTQYVVEYESGEIMEVEEK